MLNLLTKNIPFVKICFQVFFLNIFMYMFVFFMDLISYSLVRLENVYANFLFYKYVLLLVFFIDLITYMDKLFLVSLIKL